MLANLLTLARPLIVLDCETTGLNAQTDRIIELAFEVHKPGVEKECTACGAGTTIPRGGIGTGYPAPPCCGGTGRRIVNGGVDEWRSLIDPGVPIPAASTKVHHIYDGDMLNCRRCGIGLEAHPTRTCAEFVKIPKFIQIAQKLAKGFSHCDFAGKNVRFDLSFLDAEFRRAKVAWSYAGACVLDADRLEQLAEPRHLAALHKKYAGMEHDDAHSALSDVRATTTVLVKQLERYEATLPRSLRKLHELSWPNFIDSSGKFRMQDGEPYVMFGKHKGTPMKAVPQDYWTWMAGADFSDEVKAIALDAAMGRFPRPSR